MTLPKLSKKILVFTLILLALGTATISSFYFYFKYQQIKKSTKTAQSSGEQIKSLIAKVASHIELPAGEEPTIATVSNKEKIKNQPFFSAAENGDNVLIFTIAKKAILYRPSIDKIIEVAPVNLGSPGDNLDSKIATASPTQSIRAKVAIYNGSKTAGLAASTQMRLKDKFSEITVVQKSNSTGEYEKNLVIDLTGRQKQLTEEMAKFLEGEVKSFPPDELKPAADILIIVVN